MALMRNMTTNMKKEKEDNNMEENLTLGEKYRYQLNEIEYEEAMILDKIDQIKNSYNNERLKAANYVEEKYGMDPDEVVLMDYHDFKKTYGDTFKSVDSHDKTELNDLYKMLNDVRKLKEKVQSELDALKIINLGR